MNTSSDRAGLSEKWLRASEAARRAEHYFPADCLAEAARVVNDLSDRLAVAEQERGEADRQREARDRWIGIAQQFHAKAEAAEQEAATLCAQVAAVEALATRITSRVEMLSDRAHYSSTADGRERNTWILAERELRTALGDSAQVVRRIKDEAVTDALGRAKDAVRDRKRHMASYGASEEHLGALDDAYGVVANLWRDAERAGRVRGGGE